MFKIQKWFNFNKSILHKTNLFTKWDETTALVEKYIKFIKSRTRKKEIKQTLIAVASIVNTPKMWTEFKSFLFRFDHSVAGIYKWQLSPGTRIGIVSGFFLNIGKVFAKLCNELFQWEKNFARQKICFSKSRPKRLKNW